MVGVNNILISPIVQDNSESQDDGNKQLNKFSRGLTLLDVQAIRSSVPSVKRISPEISFNASIVLNGMRYSAKLVGLANDYFGLYNLPLSQGMVFNDYQEEYLS